jgi:chromosome segregation ATPase
MEKRVPGSKSMEVNGQELKKSEVGSADQKLAKIKEALKGIDWNYDTLFDDLNGFIEGHEASANKLKLVEAEKQRMSSELNKNEQKIQFLSKKLQDNQNELNYVKRGYQLRVDELLGIKNELQQKFEGLGQKKILNDEKIKEMSTQVKAKEAEIVQYKLKIEKTEMQLEEMNKTFAEKIQKFKQQMMEKSDSKEKLLLAKTNRVSAEKDQLQKYVSELMSDNNRYNQDVQKIKKNLIEANQQKDLLLNQKNILSKKIEDNDKSLKISQNKVNNLENEILLLTKRNQEKDDFIVELKKNTDEQKIEVSKLEANKNKLEQHLKHINQELKDKNLLITDLNSEISELKKLLLSLEHFRSDYEIAKKEISGLNKQILDLNEQSSLLKNENAGIQKLVQKYQIEIDELKIKNLNLSQQYLDLQNENEKNIEVIKLQKSELQETINSLSKDLKESNVKMEARTSEFDLQSAKVQDLLKNLTEVKSQNAELEETLGSALESKVLVEEELAQAHLEVNQIKDKIVAKAIEVENLKKSLTAYEATKASLNSLNLELSGEKKQNLILLEKITASVNKIEMLENSNAVIKKEKDQLSIALKMVEENSVKEIGEINESLLNTKNILSRKVSDIKSLEAKISVLENNELELIKKNDGLNHKIQLLQDEIASSEDRSVETQDQISAFNVIKNQLELEIIDNRQKIGVLERQVEEYIATLETERQKFSDLKTEFALMEQKLSIKAESESQAHEQMQEVEYQRLMLKNLADDLKFELSEREHDLVQKQKMIDDVITERKKISLRNEELSSEISGLNIELDSKNSDLESEKKMSQELESDLKSKISEIMDLKSEMSKGQIKIVNLNELVLEFKKDKENLKAQIDELNIICDDLKIKAKESKQEHLVEVKGFESEIEQMKLEKQGLLDKEFELNQDIKTKEALLQKYHLNIESLESKINDLTEDLNLKQSLIAQKDELEFELNDKIKFLETQASDLGFKVLQAAERYEDMVHQKQMYEKDEERTKKLYSVLKVKDDELKVAMSSLAKREEQLSLYSRWVDSQKEGIQRQVIKLASELTTTKEMNPLHPYLKITEREISKIEVLMTKSNVFGPQRAQLENQYEQLIKQRDEVRELLVRTNLEVDHKAQALISVLKSSEFIPVPPLPPGKVEESETELTI